VFFVGRLLYRRAKELVGDATALERSAQRLSAGWEAEIGLSVEVLFPTWLLLRCLDRFGEDSPHTRLEVYESVMQGAGDDLLSGRAQLAVTAHVPRGFLGDPLIDVRFIAVANPEHPLHKLGRPLTGRDLRQHRRLIVRETSAERSTATGLDTGQRWTVSNMATSIGAACRGYGFAWFPEDKIRSELEDGTLKPLPLRSGAERRTTLYVVLADADAAGPGVTRLAAILSESTRALSGKR